MGTSTTDSGHPNVRVAAAIIARNNHILAAQRGPGALQGAWEFPGGKLEADESPEEAVRRECAEELGLHLAALWPFAQVDYDYPDFHLSMEVFMAPLAPGQEPQALVHEKLRWLGRSELGEVAWLPSDEELIRSLATSWEQLFNEMHL